MSRGFRSQSLKYDALIADYAGWHLTSTYTIDHTKFNNIEHRFMHASSVQL